MDKKTRKVLEECEKFIDESTPEELAGYEDGLNLNYEIYDLSKDIEWQQDELDFIFKRLHTTHTKLRLLPVCDECGYVFRESFLSSTCPKCKRIIDGIIKDEDPLMGMKLALLGLKEALEETK